MTANEARDMTLISKKDLAAVYASIKTMAETGYNECVFSLYKLLDPDKYKEVLEGEGFTVTISRNHFSITW